MFGSLHQILRAVLANRKPHGDVGTRFAVAEAELGIYQHLGIREQASRAAKRFLKLVPKNPEAMFGYAQATLFCARTCIALTQYRKFLDRWPSHELAANADQAIEICETESRRRVRDANEKGILGLEFEEGGLEFFAWLTFPLQTPGRAVRLY